MPPDPDVAFYSARLVYVDVPSRGAKSDVPLAFINSPSAILK